MSFDFSKTLDDLRSLATESVREIPKTLDGLYDRHPQEVTFRINSDIHFLNTRIDAGVVRFLSMTDGNLSSVFATNIDMSNAPDLYDKIVRDFTGFAHKLNRFVGRDPEDYSLGVLVSYMRNTLMDTTLDVEQQRILMSVAYQIWLSHYHNPITEIPNYFVAEVSEKDGIVVTAIRTKYLPITKNPVINQITFELRDIRHMPYAAIIDLHTYLSTHDNAHVCVVYSDDSQTASMSTLVQEKRNGEPNVRYLDRLIHAGLRHHIQVNKTALDQELCSGMEQLPLMQYITDNPQLSKAARSGNGVILAYSRNEDNDALRVLITIVDVPYNPEGTVPIEDQRQSGITSSNLY